ncbi:putative DNA binding protein [Hibiscus syriacus]|uniref:DNA binding protein n=1 Tax=Hibiscus syriacus TaxID=106335 RepID=A0A6A3CX42_HIBSY|nr:thioredoxin-related transmembrane protein 2-like [Hibiscus syriacus]XP_039019468.1 thioredoxin-related transmembrane protein 2-like [Hibiscus syriacus]KAE8731709.1 putative DNA binding protein [Hibiscus syriacus]
MKNQSNLMEWLNQVVGEPYYFFHFLAFFSYFIVRSSAANILSPQITQHLFHREIQAILAFLMLSAYKMVREETWEGFIADALFFGKIFLIALTLIMDYHLTLWYIVLFSVIYVIAQQPPFEKLGSSSKLTPLQLEALLTEGNTPRFWLVEFRASFSSGCRRASRCFPELSITYSNKNLSFGIVDLGLFPNAAEKFGISPGGSMGQLPTYILFENDTEVSRFPEFNFEETPTPPITTRLLARHFELDRLLLEYVNGK